MLSSRRRTDRPQSTATSRTLALGIIVAGVSAAETDHTVKLAVCDGLDGAAAIITALASDNPPLHLPLGPVAVELVGTTLAAQSKEIHTWSDLSSSTNLS